MKEYEKLAYECTLIKDEQYYFIEGFMKCREMAEQIAIKLSLEDFEQYYFTVNSIHELGEKEV